MVKTIAMGSALLVALASANSASFEQVNAPAHSPESRTGDCAANGPTDEWGCCFQVDLDTKVLGTACVNITVDPSKFDGDAKFSWNGRVVYDEPFDFAKPYVCEPIPDFPYVTACVGLDHIVYNRTSSTIHACGYTSFDVLHYPVLREDLYCRTINVDRAAASTIVRYGAFDSAAARKPAHGVSTVGKALVRAAGSLPTFAQRVIGTSSTVKVAVEGVQ